MVLLALQIVFAAPGVQATDHPSAAGSITNSIGMKLVRIPAGEFLMGSDPSDPGGRDDEQPQHLVRITRPFYLGVYEVTQAEFQTISGTNPASFTREGLLKNAPADLDTGRLPVDGLTWYRAVEFCRLLSARPEESQAGRLYRLPTEAEWEYACRAGTTTTFHFGDSLSSTQANFNGEQPSQPGQPGPFLKRTAAVGSFQPNAFGLFDMHGNLHEWCLDWFDRDYYRRSPVDDPRGPDHGSRRVIRGGDWYSEARDCRSAFRYADVPAGRFYALGMRVVCELTSEGAVPDPVIADADQTELPVAESEIKLSPAIMPDPLAGEDWPRWRGPRGDGTWNSPRLTETWPAAGLPQAWRQDLGGGYGGIAVSAGRVFVMDRQQDPADVERLLCLDAVTGALLWSHVWPVRYDNVSYGNGPRSTPTIVDNRVYVLGAVGDLHCFHVPDGAVLWSTNIATEFQAGIPGWGWSASPLAFGSLVIIHVGAAPDACYVAFDQLSGEVRWKALGDPAGYATPVLTSHSGMTHLIAWTPKHVHGLNPETGQTLWSSPFEVMHGNAIADPVCHDGMVVVSSYYGGSQAIRIPPGSEAPAVVWHDRLNLRGLMSQPLYRDGYGYLLDKRHGLTCFEFSTGTRIWDDDNRLTPKGRNPQATLIWLNDADRAMALNSDGELVLLRLNTGGYQEDSRAKILGETWAHPACAGNCVFARSDTEICCVVLPRMAP